MKLLSMTHTSAGSPIFQMPSSGFHKYERLPTGPEKPAKNDTARTGPSLRRVTTTVVAVLGIFTVGLVFGLTLGLKSNAVTDGGPLRKLRIRCSQL